MPELPDIEGIKWIPIATHKGGWNVKKNRAAKKGDPWEDICRCDYCDTDPCYGSHYCKRETSDNARFYPDHQHRWF